MYSFWKAALADPSQIGISLPVHENEPQPGFYRVRNIEGGDMIPVAIWRNGSGDLVAKSGPKMTDPYSIWTFCCRNPVPEDQYRGVMAGGVWPDSIPENEAVAAIGHNLPEDPFEALQLELSGEVEIAKDLLKKPVKDQDAADKVANFAKRVSTIGKKADELFAIEKRPALDAAKAVDEKWRDVRDTAKKIAADLKRHLDAYLAEQRRIEQERQRKAADEAAEKRRKAEEAARKAADINPNPDDPEQKAAEEEANRLADDAAKAERDAKERTVSAGRTGSKVSLRKVKFAVITDYDALLAALKDREEIRELVTSLANRAAKSGVELPGMKIEEEERAI